MLRRALHSSSQRQKVRLLRSERHDVCYSRSTVSQRASLVKNDRVHSGELVEDFACLYEQTNRYPLPASDGGQHGRGDPEGAWIAHDDGSEQHKCRSRVTAGEERPAQKCQSSGDEDHRTVVVHQAISEQL